MIAAILCKDLILFLSNHWQGTAIGMHLKGVLHFNFIKPGNVSTSFTGYCVIAIFTGHIHNNLSSY